jgi:hypothetical protein
VFCSFSGIQNRNERNIDVLTAHLPPLSTAWKERVSARDVAMSIPYHHPSDVGIFVQLEYQS